MKNVLIFGAALLHQCVVNFLLLLQFLIKNAGAVGAVAFDILRVVNPP